MPLLWLSLAFLMGLLLGHALPPLWPFSLAAAWCFAGRIFFEDAMLLARFPWYLPYREQSHLPLAVVLAAACLGIMRWQAAQAPLTENDLAWYNGRGEFRLEGIIQQPPEIRDTYIHLILSVDRLVPLLDGQPQGAPRTVKGLVLVYLPPGRDWRYGDRIQLSGKPQEPESEGADFYRDYLARQGIFSTLSYPAARLVAHDQGSWFLSALYDFRALADRTITRLLPQPESSSAGGNSAGGRQRFAGESGRCFPRDWHHPHHCRFRF